MKKIMRNYAGMVVVERYFHLFAHNSGKLLNRSELYKDLMFILAFFLQISYFKTAPLTILKNKLSGKSFRAAKTTLEFTG